MAGQLNSTWVSPILLANRPLPRDCRAPGFSLLDLSSHSRLCPLVVGGQLVQVVQDELLEDSEQQGDSDLVTVEARKVRAFFYDGKVIEPCLPNMQTGASDIVGGLA